MIHEYSQERDLFVCLFIYLSIINFLFAYFFGRRGGGCCAFFISFVRTDIFIFVFIIN